MEEKKKDLARFAINDDEMSSISGGVNLDNITWEYCDQCGLEIGCSKSCTLEDHKKKFCEKRNNS